MKTLVGVHKTGRVGLQLAVGSSMGEKKKKKVRLPCQHICKLSLMKLI